MKHYNLVLSANNDIHYAEHSIEVQVPFIRYFFPNASIVPVLINDTNETSKQLATVLSDVIEHDSTKKKNCTNRSKSLFNTTTRICT